MNIGMFSDTYFPQKNGVSTVIKLYKEELEKMGHNVLLFVPKFDRKHKRTEDWVHEFPSVRYVFERGQRLAMPITPTAFKMKDFNLDLIHVHSPFTMSFFGKLVARSLDIPIIATHHTLFEFYLHYVPKLVRPSIETVRKLMVYWCKMFDKIIAPTQNISDLLLQMGLKEEDITVIPSGIDMDSFRKPAGYDLRRELSLSAKDKVMLFVGRLGKEKNISFLIDVYAQARKQIPELKFVLVGEGEDRAELSKYSESRGVGDGVLFTGGLERKDVIDVYKQSDIFTFASYTETQGLVVLESMAAGTPVVALGKMGVYDLLKNPEAGGIMIDELDEGKFVRSIVQVLKNREFYSDLSGRGLKFVDEKFSCENSVKRTLELYETILAFKAATSADITYQN